MIKYKLVENSFVSTSGKAIDFNDIGYIVFYKTIYLLFHKKGYFLVKVDEQHDVEFRNLFFDCPNVVFESQTTPFPISKYCSAAKKNLKMNILLR